MLSKKNAENYIPFCKDQGMPSIAAASKAGVALQNAKVTLSGASHAVVLEAIGLKNMADVNYSIIVDGETAARITVDEQSITAIGFTIQGGALNEIAHVVIVGCLEGQAQ